jgi:hypothetical protein
MPVEYSAIVLPLDERQQEALDQKALEGWQMVPGMQPIGIWLVFREQVAQLFAGAGRGTMQIDDNRVFILRNGQFIDKDGNVVPTEVARAMGLTIP